MNKRTLWEPKVVAKYYYALTQRGYTVSYPNHSSREVDLVAEKGSKITIIEVKISSDVVQIDRAVGQILRYHLEAKRAGKQVDTVRIAAIGPLTETQTELLQQLNIEYEDLTEVYFTGANPDYINRFGEVEFSRISPNSGLSQSNSNITGGSKQQ